MKEHKNLVLRGMIFLESVLVMIIFYGCGIEETATKKVRDVKFTVIEDSEVPEGLLIQMEEKKKEGFKLTYSDKENLYIAVGYGEQKTGGYSISVDQCYLTKNAVYFATTLTGPAKGEKVNEVPSYPSVVVKAEYLDEIVVFE